MANIFDKDEDFDMDEEDEDFDMDEEDEDEEFLFADIDDEELIKNRKFGFDKKILNNHKRITKKWSKPSKPPIPPAPPPPSIHLHKPPAPHDPINTHKVIGIRGLNKRLYKKIRDKARERGSTVSELMNEILYQYLDEYFESETISGIDSLELHEEELNELGDSSIILSEIKRLVIGPNVTKESFSKIKEIKNTSRVYVPDRLFLLTLKKTRHCGKIEKYSGDLAPRVVSKSFNSDISLSREFFEYFIDTNTKVDLVIYGELEIEDDVTVDHLKNAINYLRVDNDIRIPKHLKGWMYAKAECYGEIEIDE